MALSISESDAVDILVSRLRADGAVGLKNFARNILGAHSGQAKRLADIAVQIEEGRDPTTLDIREEERLVQVRQEVEGKELNLTLKADRLPLTSYQELVDFYEIDTDVWHPTSQVFNFWGSGENPNFQVKARFQKDEYKAATKEDREAFREWASQFAPELEIPWMGSENGKMLELVISDLHADRVGGLDRSLDDMLSAVSDICGKTHALYGTVDEANIILLGDTFNSDNGRDTTTAGTPQNSEVDWRESFRLVREAIVTAAATTATYAKNVRIHVLPGNHDYEKAYYLADSLWAYFHRTDGVGVVLDDSPRRYLEWGANLIGLTHGDRVKPGDLAMTMYREADTSGKRVLEWHLGHIHTRREDEHHGVGFQWFRSAQTVHGEWEQKNLFNHNRKDVTGIVWDEQTGPEDTFRFSVGSDL